MARSRHGFSLVELLMVIAILVVLVGILLPAIGLVRDAARTTECLGKLRQLGIATGVYVGENSGLLYEGQVSYTTSDPIWGLWPCRLMPLLLDDVGTAADPGNGACWNRWFNCPASNWTVGEIEALYRQGIGHGLSCAWCTSYGYNGRLTTGTGARRRPSPRPGNPGFCYTDIRVGNALSASTTILLGEKWGVAENSSPPCPDDRAGVDNPGQTLPVPAGWPRQTPPPAPCNSASIRLSHRGRTNLLFLDLHTGTHALADTWNGVNWNVPGSWWAGLP